MPTPVPMDSHVHSEWSWHAADGSMDRSCARAVELGLPAFDDAGHLESVERCRALEINTSLPLHATLLSWWHDEGGDAVTFGSDAHDPAGVARGFGYAIRLAEAHGFRPGRDPDDLWGRAGLARRRTPRASRRSTPGGTGTPSMVETEHMDNPGT